MAAYYKVEVTLNSQSVTVGIPSPQSVEVTLPRVGPAGPQGPQGEKGDPGEVSGSIAWDNVTEKPSTFPPSAHTHVAADITDFTSAVEAVSPPADWNTLANKPSSFTPSAHGSTHHTGGTDAIAPNNISAAWALVTSQQTITGNTLLSAGRNRRITLFAVGVTADVDLPYENNQNGDVVTLVSSWSVASTLTIRRALVMGGSTPVAYSTLATLNASGQSFTFVSDGTATGWSLRAVDTHTHTANQVTDFATAAAAAAPVASVAGRTGAVTLAVADVANAVSDTDARLSDARTPTSHTHGSITNDGKLGTTAGLPLVTTTAGAITTLALGSANQVLRVNSGATGVEFGAGFDAASPPAIGSTTPAAGTFTTLTANNGTLTASAPVLDLAQTWNNAAVTFRGVNWTFTDTASSISSEVLRIFTGAAGTSAVFNIRKDGNATFANGVNVGTVGGAATIAGQNGQWRVSSGGAFGWTDASNNAYGTMDLSLTRDAADTLAQRRAASPQTFRLYNTFTSATNFERLTIGWASNIVSIKPEAGGAGGTVRELHISGLPTSDVGTGILWNDGGTVKVGA